MKRVALMWLVYFFVFTILVNSGLIWFLGTGIITVSVWIFMCLLSVGSLWSFVLCWEVLRDNKPVKVEEWVEMDEDGKINGGGFHG